MAFSSPKRKREEPQMPPLQTTSLIPRFPPLLSDGDADGGNSPRTNVAGKFQRLELERSSPEFRLEPEDRETKRVAYGSEMDDEPERLIPSPSHQVDSFYGIYPEAKPPSTDFSFEPANLTPYPKVGNERPRSPLPGGETISDQYWHESEITGHDPDDPTDDGYGINGIGFKPSAAIAWARSQKRKQQLADYRNREAKEAREKRRERRKVGSGDFSSISPLDETKLKNNKVRFEDG